MMSKAQLRQRMKATRGAISPAKRAAWSAMIHRRVLALPAVAEARSIFCYVDAGSEVHTRALMTQLLARGVTVAVPRMACDGGATRMEAWPIDSLADLVPGRWGVPEPPATPPSQATTACDVAFVPGLAFTRAGDRLGMGGGFYDRYLADHPRTLAIGLCFEQQIVDRLPAEPHDMKMHVVVTQGQGDRAT